jgi:hypothetical protein
MATRTEVTVPVISRNNRDLPATQATLNQVVWDKADRTRNALRTLGMWLIATFAAVFIPLLHWVLVPGLFIAAFVLGMDKFGETVRNEGGKGECPKCHQTFSVQASKWREKQTENCEACHDDLEIELGVAPA